jgi:hypothetical protein
MTMSWRSGDGPRKGRFEDPRKEPRAPNPNILGPIFTPKAIFGRFLVGLGPVRVDFSSVDFGRIFSTVLDVDFGWFCSRLQFDVKRRAGLAKTVFGPRFECFGKFKP